MLSSSTIASQHQETSNDAERAMKQATIAMMEKVSRDGGFVWGYLPDFSRTWGELEAYPTSVWVQSPGTPAVGNILLDAYHATKDEFYYTMAEKVANILIFGQLECGGWNYFFDLAGESSIQKWYKTIGKNAWGCSEFHKYYGNATFDDKTTSDAANFILRIYLEKHDPRFKVSLDKAINFILESQYPIGGWPQRYPLVHVKNNESDYSNHITLNDAVLDENIEFLLRCYHLLSDKRAYDAIIRAMNCVKSLQQNYPTAGWADQYSLDLKPASAREFEPAAISISTTVSSINNLMYYYRMTGDTTFLSGIPAALDFIESVVIKDPGNSQKRNTGKKLCPRFFIPGTATPLYIHRRGNHVNNGSYYFDQNPENTIGHYSSVSYVNTEQIRREYIALKAIPVSTILSNSILLNPGKVTIPEFYSGELNKTDEKSVISIINSLNSENLWISPLTYITNPYIGEGKADDPASIIYKETLYGKYNTALYKPEQPVYGISTSKYINNMFCLIRFIRSEK